LKFRSSWRRFGQPLLIIVIIAFWARAIWHDWNQLANANWRVNWWLLGLSFAVLIVQALVVAVAWWWTLVMTGERLPLRQGVGMWLQSQLARYLPGGVWDMTARVVMGRQAGVSVRSTSASLVLEMGMQILSGAVFLVIALVWREETVPPAYLAVAAAAILAMLIVMLPPVFVPLTNWGLRILRRPPLEMRLTYPGMVGIFGVRLFGHLLLGIGFVLFVSGLQPVSPTLFVPLASAYVGAWLIGVLAIFVPAGIGVREGALYWLLGGQFPLVAVATVALGYRLLISARDLLVALYGRQTARPAGVRDQASLTENVTHE
jgi:uncharacterized membrane protein YbhN (UPF0104 family)